MRIFPALAMISLAACAPALTAVPEPEMPVLPGTATILDAADGRRIPAGELIARIAAADFVLLGELHDNPAHHAIRGQLISAFAARQPAVVFEQFAESAGPIAPPAPAESREAWLDRHGFDRAAWNWPLHEPVVAAAIESGGTIWGSGVSRERLRSVVRDGESAAPAHLRTMMANNPLGSAGQATLDRELVESHCGQLPANMVPGMRAAQIVRDAAMTNALRLAAADGPAWLIAGNGHVRRDVAVPRLLRALEPDRSLLVIGFLERAADGGEPAAQIRALYDVVVIVPRIERPDPCAGFEGR